MDQAQAHLDLTTIREAIEKTRRDTAESGKFFIAIGLLCILFTLAIGLLEHYQLSQLQAF